MRQIEADLRIVDIVIELLDARIPIASQNPEIANKIKNKKKLVVLNKADLADEKANQKWIAYFEKQGIPAVLVDSNSGKGIDKFIKKIEEIMQEMLEGQANKGRVGRKIRAMILGIPNVGKSSFINRISKRTTAEVGNKPGITKQKQWIRINEKIELLDTPGVLWHKFATEKEGLMLALSGAIKDSLFAKDDVALFALQYLRANRLTELKQRYHLSDADVDESVTDPDLLLTITKKMGFRDDYDRGSERLIFDLRKGKLGTISLEKPADINAEGLNE